MAYKNQKKNKTRTREIRLERKRKRREKMVARLVADHGIPEESARGYVKRNL